MDATAAAVHLISPEAAKYAHAHTRASEATCVSACADRHLSYTLTLTHTHTRGLCAFAKTIYTTDQRNADHFGRTLARRQRGA